MAENVYNIGLQIEDSTGGDLEKYSAELDRLYSSRFVLGRDSIPHVTLVQAQTEMEPQKFWEMFAARGKQAVKLTMAGICVLPTEGEDIWLEVPVLRSQNLEMLHKQAVDLAEQVGARILSGVGDAYRPHVTVGLINRTSLQQIFSTPVNPLRTDGVKCVPYLALSGPNYTVGEILFK